MIKAVLFDFDGTLADTLPFYIKAYDVALRACGLSKSDKEIVENCFGKRVEDTCTYLGIAEKTEKFSTAYFDAVKILFKDAKLFGDTIKTLHYLQENNIKLAIITFAYRWYINQMMKQFNLISLVDLIISADEVTKPKPDPEAIYKATTLFKIKPEDTMVVGDSKSDILMAKAAKSKSVLIFPKDYSRYYDFEDLKKTNPDFTVQNVGNIISLL
ncbi:MAG: HAD family hydrolase [bacterium]